MSDDGWHEGTHWDQNPVIELGNAWITFGDVLYEQAMAMDSAQFDLINGGWMGTASTSMTVAFHNQSNGSDAVGNYGLQPNVVQVAIDSWNMGEAINYFAMLRNEQQATEAKEALASLIATLLGLGLAILASVIGEILGLVASLISRLVATLIEVGGIVGEAVASLAGFAARIGSWVDEASTAAAAAYPWSTKIAGIAYDITKFGVEFTSISALATLGGNAAAGLPTDWKHWSPVPTTAAGWAEFIELGIMLAPIQAVATAGLKGLINKAKPVGGSGVLNIPRSQLPGGRGVPNVSVAGGRGNPPVGGPRNADGTPSDIVAPNSRVTDGGQTVVNSRSFTDHTTVVRTGPDPTDLGTGRSAVDGPPVTADIGHRADEPTGVGSEPVLAPAPRPVAAGARVNEPVRTVTDRPVQQPGQEPAERSADTVGPVPPPARTGHPPARTASDPNTVVQPATGRQDRTDPSTAADPDTVVALPPPRTSHAPAGANLDATPQRSVPHGDSRTTGDPADATQSRPVDVTAGQRPAPDGARTTPGAEDVRTAPPDDVVRTGSGADPTTTLPPVNGVRAGAGPDVVRSGAGSDRVTNGAAAVKTGASQTEGGPRGDQRPAAGSGDRTGDGNTPVTAERKVTGVSAATQAATAASKTAEKAAVGAAKDLRDARAVLTTKEHELTAAERADTAARAGGGGADAGAPGDPAKERPSREQVAASYDALQKAAGKGPVPADPAVESAADQARQRHAEVDTKVAALNKAVKAERKAFATSISTQAKAESAQEAANAAAKAHGELQAKGTASVDALQESAGRMKTTTEAAQAAKTLAGEAPKAAARALGDVRAARAGLADALGRQRVADAVHAKAVADAGRRGGGGSAVPREGSSVRPGREQVAAGFEALQKARDEVPAPADSVVRGAADLARQRHAEVDTKVAALDKAVKAERKAFWHAVSAQARAGNARAASEAAAQASGRPARAASADEAGASSRPFAAGDEGSAGSADAARGAQATGDASAQAARDAATKATTADTDAARAAGDVRTARAGLADALGRQKVADAVHAKAVADAGRRGGGGSAVPHAEVSGRPGREVVAASFEALQKARDEVPAPADSVVRGAADLARQRHAEVDTKVAALDKAVKAERKAFWHAVSAQARAGNARAASEAAAEGSGRLARAASADEAGARAKLSAADEGSAGSVQAARGDQAKADASAQAARAGMAKATTAANEAKSTAKEAASADTDAARAAGDVRTAKAGLADALGRQKAADAAHAKAVADVAAKGHDGPVPPRDPAAPHDPATARPDPGEVAARHTPPSRSGGAGDAAPTALARSAVDAKVAALVKAVKAERKAFWHAVSAQARAGNARAASEAAAEGSGRLARAAGADAAGARAKLSAGDEGSAGSVEAARSARATADASARDAQAARDAAAKATTAANEVKSTAKEAASADADAARAAGDVRTAKAGLADAVGRLEKAEAGSGAPGGGRAGGPADPPPRAGAAAKGKRFATLNDLPKDPEPAPEPPGSPRTPDRPGAAPDGPGRGAAVAQRKPNRGSDTATEQPQHAAGKPPEKTGFPGAGQRLGRTGDKPQSTPAGTREFPGNGQRLGKEPAVATKLAAEALAKVKEITNAKGPDRPTGSERFPGEGRRLGAPEDAKLGTAPPTVARANSAGTSSPRFPGVGQRLGVDPADTPATGDGPVRGTQPVSGVEPAAGARSATRAGAADPGRFTGPGHRLDAPARTDTAPAGDRPAAAQPPSAFQGEGHRLGGEPGTVASGPRPAETRSAPSVADARQALADAKAVEERAHQDAVAAHVPAKAPREAAEAAAEAATAARKAATADAARLRKLTKWAAAGSRRPSDSATAPAPTKPAEAGALTPAEGGTAKPAEGGTAKPAGTVGPSSGETADAAGTTEPTSSGTSSTAAPESADAATAALAKAEQSARATAETAAEGGTAKPAGTVGPSSGETAEAASATEPTSSGTSSTAAPEPADAISAALAKAEQSARAATEAEAQAATAAQAAAATSAAARAADDAAARAATAVRGAQEALARAQQNAAPSAAEPRPAAGTAAKPRPAGLARPSQSAAPRPGPGTPQAAAADTPQAGAADPVDRPAVARARVAKITETSQREAAARAAAEARSPEAAAAGRAVAEARAQVAAAERDVTAKAAAERQAFAEAVVAKAEEGSAKAADDLKGIAQNKAFVAGKAAAESAAAKTPAAAGAAKGDAGRPEDPAATAAGTKPQPHEPATVQAAAPGSPAAPRTRTGPDGRPAGRRTSEAGSPTPPRTRTDPAADVDTGAADGAAKSEADRPQDPAAPPAAVPRPPDLSDTPRFVSRAQLPTRDQASPFLPSSEQAVVVGGMYRVATNRMYLDGSWRDAAGVADWIRRRTAWDPDAPVPVVLVAGQAGRGHLWAGLPSFGMQVAQALGGEVIAPVGHPVDIVGTDLLAGSPEPHGDGAVLHVSDANGWVGFRPGRSDALLGPDLGAALGAYGIALLPPEQVSETPTVWSFGPEAPPRTAVHAHPSGSRTGTPPRSVAAQPGTPPQSAAPEPGTPQEAAAPQADAPPESAVSRTDTPSVTSPADPEPLPSSAGPKPLPTGAVMSRVRTPGPAHRPPTPVRPAPAAAGASVAPLPPRTAVAFSEGSTELGDAQEAEVVALARQVARSGLLAMRARLPLPVVSITGYGNGTRHLPGAGDRGEDARATGMRRAAAAEEAFRRELDRRLAVLQAEAEAETQAWAQTQPSTPGGASDASSMVMQDYLTSHSFTITMTSGGRDIAGGSTGRAGGSSRGVVAGPSGPAARRQAVIGIAESPHAAAAARLAALAQADPEQGGPFDAESLLYSVLHLDWSQDPDDSHYQALYTLVEQAAADGRATSLAALGAYRLVQLGALADEFRVTAADGTRLGLNWSEDPVGDLDTTSYDVLTSVATSHSAPWSKRPEDPRPYLVVAEGTSTSVRVGTSGGARRTARSREVAALLTMDRELSALGDGVPVLMLVPRAADGGLEVPRAVADATGRVVWAHSGDVSVEPPPQGRPRTRMGVRDLRAAGVPMGAWIASEPGFEAPDPLGTVQTFDDGPIRDAELSSHPLSFDGRPIGRSVFNDADQAARELHDLHDLPAQTRSYRYDSVTGEYLPGPAPMPWAGRDVYYFVLHGEPGRMALQNGRRQVKASGEQVGGYLKRRPSLRRLAPDVPIALVSCWADTPGDDAPDLNEASRAPFVADPLRTVSGAQAVANATGRTVFAPDRTHFFGRLPGGTTTVQMIADTALNEPGAWHEVRPEPLDDALDELARAAGLRPAGDDPAAAADARAAVLRLVRALRQTFGVTVEDDADDADDPAGEYRRLLRGIGALEAMRRADPDLRDEGPFTRDLLDRAARAHRDLHSGTPAPRDRAPTADDVRAVLEAAAAHLAASPGAALRDFVALPSVDRALDLLRTGDRTARAAQVLRTVEAGQPAGLSDADRSRLLWATVKAVEAVEGAPDVDALAAKVLHLGGGEPPDPARRTELLWLVATAAAAGVDPRNPSALAAYHLVRGGALSSRTLMRGAGGRAVGRNWTIPGPAGPVWNPVVGALDGGGYLRSTDGTTDAGEKRAAPWRDPAAATSPESYVVVVTQGAAGHVDLRWHDGTTRAVPYDEIAELLLLDPRLSQRGAQGKIVLVGSQDPALPAALSDRAATARAVTASTRPTALARDAADGKYWIVLTAADPQAPEADDWHDVRPRPAGAAAPAVTSPQPPVAQGPAGPAADVWFQPLQPPDEAGSPASTADSLDMMMDWEDAQDAQDAQDAKDADRDDAPAAEGSSGAGGPAAEAKAEAADEEAAGEESSDDAADIDEAAATEAHHHRILTDLYGPGIVTHRLHPALRDAVSRLDTLRRTETEPALRDGPLNIDAVTRRVLLLGPDEPVTDAQRGELLRVALDEAVADAAGLPALAAFHLTLRGVLSPTRALGGPAGGVRGRNWTGSGLGDLDPSTAGVSVPAPGGGLTLGDVEPALWGRPGDPAPYTVVASGSHDHVEVRGFKDARFKAPRDVFAELLLLDPALAALPADVPVLLLVPGAGARGLDLPRTAAGRTGRATWSASGPVRLARQDPAGPLVPSLVAGPGARRGDWVVSLPGELPDPAARREAAPWEGEVLTQPVVADGRPIGRSLFSDAEAPAVEPYLRHAAAATELWHENRATGTWSMDPHPVPWAGRPVYVAALHSLPGRSHLPLDGGTVKIARGTETGGFLKRRPSLSRLSDEHVIVMEGCWYGSAADGDVITGDGVRDPFVADPLATVSDAQHTANETGRTVFGSTRTTGIVRLPAPYDRYVHVLRTDAQGRPGQWLEYRPEPSGTALDEVARGAGLHEGDGPADPAVRERALRLVRALRRAFGPGIDQDASYPALLAGIGALEEMRADDPLLGDVTPFTMDLFDRAALAGRGADTGTPTADDYSALLTRAATAAEQAPGTALTDFVPLPRLAAAAQRTAGLSDADAARILRLGDLPDAGAPAVGPRERARVFWATAKALEWENRAADPDAVGAPILHLAQPDPARRAELLDVVAGAAAAGRDLDDPTALAAFHLELLGAFSPQTRLADAQGRTTGRNWFSGAPLDGPVSTAGVTTAQRSPAGGFTALGTAPAPWAGPGRPAPYVLWGQADPDRFLLRLPGGATVDVPYEEVGELLSHDPELAGRPLDADVVLAVAHAGPGQVSAGAGPAAIGGRTGRTVWSSPGMARLARGAAGPFAVTSLRTGPGPHPATAPWVPARRREAAPAGPGAGESSVTFAPHPGGQHPPPAHPPGTRLAPVPEDATAPTPKPVAVVQDLDTHRPPRLDRDLPPPATAPGPVEFSDGTRLPLYMGGVGAALPGLPPDVARRSFSFGDGDPVLRGTELVVAEVRRELASLPVAPRGGSAGTGLLADLGQQLRTAPRTFFGDGRAFAYSDAKGRTRVLTVVARPYQEWDRFAFGFGNPTKIDTMRRGTTTTGRSAVNSTTVALAPTVLLGPAKNVFNVWGRILARRSWSKRVEYPMLNQTANQVETRTTDGSHAHLDDVHFTFAVTDGKGRPLDGAGRPVPAGDTRTRPVEFGFAVRHGVSARLPDSAVREQPASAREGFPDRMNLGATANHRFFSTEGYGPLSHVRDWAVAQVKAKQGSSAHAQLDAFFSTENFEENAGLLAAGQVTTPALFADSSGMDPLGVFSVKVESGEALLIDATKAAEIRDIVLTTLRNERIDTKGTGLDVGGTVGPSFQLFGLGAGSFDLRLLLGFSIRYGTSRSRSAQSGGSGSIRSAAQAKGDATGLYLVRKTVYVTAPPDTRAPDPEPTLPRPPDAPPNKLRKNPPATWSSPPRTASFQTWSVERMTKTEARRLATGTGPARQQGAEPAPPPYLTGDDPATLGMSRVEEFTFADGTYTRPAGAGPRTMLEDLSDQVLRELAKAYPELVAPLDQLNPANPRWRDSSHFQLVQSNTLEVLNTLAHHSMAGNLETMMTTGLPIGLVHSRRATRAMRTVRLYARLTGRRYEGTQTDERLRFGAPGVESLGGRQGAGRGVDGGVEGIASIRDEAVDDIRAPRHAGTGSVGGRFGARQDRGSGYGPAASHDPLSISTKGSHLYSYELSITAKRGGFRRLRGLLRGVLFLNILGTQPFVLPEPESDLIGPHAGGGPAKGRVLLSVPVEHTPAAAPTTAGAPAAGGTAPGGTTAGGGTTDGGTAPGGTAPGPLTTPAPAGGTTLAERAHPLHGVLLPTTPGRARDLARSTPAALEQAGRRTPAAFQRHPAMTVVVVSHPAITRAVNEVLDESSGGSWHLTYPGAPAHDSALRTFQAPYLTANFDQSSAPTGWRTAGLWSKGPFLNRNASLVHRTAVRPGSLKAITGSIPVDTETTIGGSTQVSGTTGHTSSVFFGGQLVYLHSHAAGPGLTGNYAVVLSPYAAAYSRTLTVSRTAVAEINRKDLGRQVLIHGDVDHEFAADSSAVGESAFVKRIVPAKLSGAAGRRLLVAEGWVAHLPEKSAYRLGLLNDPWGADIPLYSAKKWSPMPWLLDAPFGSYPVNSLNAAGVLAEFDRKLAPLGLNQADRDTVHRAVGSRVVRALAKEMNGPGTTQPVRVGKWGSETLNFWLADRPARVRVQLVPEPAGGTRGAGARTGFGGLGHSAELEEHRQAAESVQDGRQRTTGPSVGWSVLESVHTGNESAKAAGPSYTEIGSSRKTRSENQAEGSVQIGTVTTTQSHGEYATAHRLLITLEIGDAPRPPAPADGTDGTDETDGTDGGPSTALTVPAAARTRHDWPKTTGNGKVVTAEGGVGTLIEYFPLSLMRPEPDASAAGPTAPDPLAPPELGPVGPPRRVPAPAVTGPGGWLDTLHPGSGEVKPFTLPADGYKPRSVIGRERVQQANKLAIAAGYDLAFPPDGPIDDRLVEKAGNTPLTRAGSGPAQVLEDGANSTALIAFHPWSLDAGGYRLPGLVHTGKFGGASADLAMFSRPEFTRAQLLTVADGVKHEAPRRTTRGGGAGVSRSGGQESALGGGPTLASEPTGSNQSGTGTGDQFSDAEQVRGGADGLASVNIKPNTARTFLFAVPTTYLSLAAVHHDVRDSAVGRGLRGAFGLAGRSPQALETDTVVLTWVREDVARGLGLIDDTGFPPKVSAAWDTVSKADKALTDADKRYWDARRGAGARVTADRDAARSAADALGDVPDAARARAAADRLARELRDAEPDHDGWSDLLRAEYEEAARVARLVTERDAAQARFDAFDTQLAALRATAETAAAELHRVRTETDRLTRWHQLAATPEGRRRLGSTPEPPEVVLGPPAPPKPAPKPTDPPAAGAAAGVRPAHIEAPWQPAAARPGRNYEPAADHRVLTATDPDGAAYTYDLTAPAADGNGFYAAVQLARGRQDDGRRLAGVVARSTRVPDDVPLDPRAVFHQRELASVLGAGFARAAGPEVAGSGGRLPAAAAARLTRTQRQALVRLDLRTARRWDAGTARTAAALTADILGVGLTVVAEDGSHEHFAGAGSGPGGPQLTVYERGGQYLAALPRGPVPAPPAVLPDTPDTTPSRTPPASPTMPAALTMSAAPTQPGSLALPADPSAPTLPAPTRPAPTLPAPSRPVTGTAPGGGVGGGPSDGGVRRDGSPDHGPSVDAWSVDAWSGDGLTGHGSSGDGSFGDGSPRAGLRGYGSPNDGLSNNGLSKNGLSNNGLTDGGLSDDGGFEDDEAVRPATTAPGAKASVPGTGECLLYSLMASDPAHVRSVLTELDPAVQAWLADPGAVRVELRWQAYLRRRYGRPPAGPAPTVVEAMRAFVADQLRDGDLDPQVLGQFRQWAAGPQLARRLAEMDRAELLGLLAHHGVGHETLESIDADDLRRRYEAVFGPDTEGLAPRRHFAALRNLGLLMTPADLNDGRLRDLITAVYPTSRAPLDDVELQVVLDAVVNWERSWAEPVGEIFLPLLAYTFDVLVDVVRDDGFRSVTGAADAARRIEVHYDSAHQHYDGSDAVPRDLRAGPAAAAPRPLTRRAQPLRRAEDPLAHRRRAPGQHREQPLTGGRPGGRQPSDGQQAGLPASPSAGSSAGSSSTATPAGHLDVTSGSRPSPRMTHQLPHGAQLLGVNLDVVPRAAPSAVPTPAAAPGAAAASALESPSRLRAAPASAAGGGLPPAGLDAEPAVPGTGADGVDPSAPGGHDTTRRRR